MNRPWIGTALSLSLFAVVALVRGAEDPPKGKPASTPPQDVLAREVGEWDAEVTVTLPGADKPMTSKAVETNTLLGGKWLISDFKGEFGGQPFRGHAQYGFDAKKGKYVGTWLDVMSTKIDMLEGSYDEATRTLTMNAETEEPGSGKGMKVRMVTAFKADGSRVFTEYVKAVGSDDYAKFMEITYAPRKK